MGRLLLALVAIGVPAVLVLATELFVLPRALGMSRDRFLMGFVSQQAVQDGVKLNALGLTGDVPEAERPPGGLRVLTLGGSVLFNRDITAKLDAALERAAGRPVETLGAALPSHTSWSAVHKYAWLRKHDFDVVLIYEGINDLLASHVRPEEFRADYSHLNPWYDRGGLLERSILARALYNDFVHRRPETVWNASTHPTAPVFRENLRWLVRNVQADGGAPVPMTFAWLVPPSYDQEAFFQGRAGYHPAERADAYPVELWGSVPWVREGLGHMNVAVHEVASEASVPVLDMHAKLAGDPRWFVDVCHLSDAGVDAFVAAVVEHLVQRGHLGARTLPKDAAVRPP